MKKNILKGTLFLVVAVASTYVANSSHSNTDLENIVLENIDALSSGESGNYSCEPPYDRTCSYEGSYRLPGIKVS